MKRIVFAAVVLAGLLPPALHAQNNLKWAEPSSSQSQGSGPAVADEANAPGLPTDPTPVPLDGGLTLLGAAGAAYAVRRLRRRRA